MPRAPVQEYVSSHSSYHADDITEVEEDLMCLLPALAPMFDASCAFHQHNRNQDLGGKVWGMPCSSSGTSPIGQNCRSSSVRRACTVCLL